MLGIPSGNLSRRRPGWRFLHHGSQTAQTRSAEMFIGSTPQTHSRFRNQKIFGGHVTEHFRRAADNVEAGSGNTALLLKQRLKPDGN